MAFEAFRAQSEAPARSGRKRLWYGISIAVHGALIAMGLVYSFWHIEELSPPLLKVTFMSAAPPPPPAAPPPAGGGAKTSKPTPTSQPKPVVQPKPEIVQPKEIPKKEEPPEKPKEEDGPGEKGSVKGGVIGGTPGGTIGGTPGGTIGGTPGGVIGAPPGAPKFLPPHLGIAQKISGEDPPCPPALRKPGAVYHVLVKVCVTVSGSVDKVMVMKSTEPQLDSGVVDTLRKNWRFRPLLANNTPVPFCYPATFEFKAH